jgi:hypothetical protein
MMKVKPPTVEMWVNDELIPQRKLTATPSIPLVRETFA